MAADRVCPENGNLRDPAALKAMLKVRASSRRNVVLLLYGVTQRDVPGLETGVVPVPGMELSGRFYVKSLVRALEWHGLNNYLVVTGANSTSGALVGAACHAALRPLGVCCGWSSAGLKALKDNRWAWNEAHPHYLKLQLWWTVARAVALGFNVLTLDYDIHLEQNPFELLSSPAFESLDVAFAGDSMWPVQLPLQGVAEDDTQGISVPCDSEKPAAASSCTCGRTPAPMINTAFCYVRAKTATAALFDGVASAIIQRLRTPPRSLEDRTKGAVRLWEQDVMNEMVYNMSRLPLHAAVSMPAACPPRDGECKLPNITQALRSTLPERWWAHASPRKSGVWLADLPRTSEGGCAWSHRELLATTEIVTNGNSAARLGVLPRSIFGRICARRRVPLAYFITNATEVLPCDFYSTSEAPRRPFLGQMALHAQSTRATMSRIQTLGAPALDHGERPMPTCAPCASTGAWRSDRRAYQGQHMGGAGLVASWCGARCFRADVPFAITAQPHHWCVAPWKPQQRDQPRRHSELLELKLQHHLP